RGGGVREELALRRQEQIDERRRERPQDEQQAALEEAADPAGLDDRARQDGDRALDQDVAVADVGELMGEDALQLRRRRRAEQASASGDCRAAGAAAEGERTRIPVREDVELRRRYPGARGEPLDGRVHRRGLRARQLAGADHPERDPVDIEVAGAGQEERAEEEDRKQPVVPREQGHDPEHRADAEEKQPRLEDVSDAQERAAHVYGSSEPSSSARPRGGQSGSGASQRLEQWSEAMFCSGTRMWPFSSMCGTSSTMQ